MNRDVCEHFVPTDLRCDHCADQHSKQPEALRLADRLRDGWGLQLRKEAEAELRRLVAQRDALLEALQDLCDEQEGPPLVRRHRQWQAAIDKALAAIAKAEENP